MKNRFYVLEIIVTIFFILNSTNSNCQSLKNTEWTRVLVENNVEGNLIVNKQLTKKPIKYLFLEDTVLISIDESYSTTALYSINGNILSIGNFVKYKIDSLSDQLLIVSDLPKQGIPASTLGIFTLMSTNFIFDFLKQSQQLTIIGDSVILANELFCPVYNGDINNIFSERGAFAYSAYKGSFTISRDGYIRDIQILKGTKDDIIRISNKLISTKGNWIIPPTPKPFDYKIDFELLIGEVGDFYGANIFLHPRKK